jgi:hypothetical protein
MKFITYIKSFFTGKTEVKTPIKLPTTKPAKKTAVKKKVAKKASDMKKELEKMTKRELDQYGATLGLQLDGRKKKQSLIDEIKKHLKK